jgi:predicted acylesterase/phospholipase RssA
MWYQKSPILAAILFALSACATITTHHPVPASFSSKATVVGFPGTIRFWADEAPANSGELIAEGINAYRAAHADYFLSHDANPPLNLLAISGGAYDGAFGAGLLSGWSASGTRPDFDVVTGVSAGAIIAPFVFIGPKYDDKLRDLFTRTASDGIFEGGIFKVMDAITGGLSLTNTKPLAKRIDEIFTQEILNEVAVEHRKGKRLFISTTNLEAQRGVIWDIGAIANSGHPDALKLFHQILLASASVPGIFPPVFIDVQAGDKHYNEIHADGGVVSQVFVYPLKVQQSAIKEFLRNHLERHLYVIINNKVTPEYQDLQPSFFTLTRRAILTLSKYHSLGDMYRLYIASMRDGIDYNLIHIPGTFSAESTELFDPKYMSKLFDVGYEMGKRSKTVWLKKPPGVDYQK